MKKTILALLLPLMVMGWTGCGKSGKHAHEDGDGHGHMIQVTAYADTLELYVEIAPLVAGKESSLLAHCTSTHTFKPVRARKAVATLSAGGAQSRAEAGEQLRPGIFQLTVTPQKAGAAQPEFVISTERGDIRVRMDNLQVFDSEEAAHEDAEKREIRSGAAVTFPKEMSWNMDFSTAPARMMEMGGVIQTVAQILPSQGDETTISAKVNGMVSLNARMLAEGCAISRGQALCVIDASATANDNLKVQYSQALAEYTKCKNEYDKLKEMEADRLVTASQLTEAKAALENARALYENLRKNFSTGRQVVSAPCGGYLKELNVGNGEYATVGQPIATITQSHTLRLKAEVQSRYYNDLKTVGEVTLRPGDKREAVSLSTLGGRMVSYGKQTSVDNPLIPVIFEMNNVGNLLPGSFVDMYIHTGKGRALAVPAEAVLEEMGNYFVYVQLTPELFEKRQVETGSTDGVNTEIRSGLKEGERVVARGAVLVKLQQASGTVDPHSGHNH